MVRKSTEAEEHEEFSGEIIALKKDIAYLTKAVEEGFRGVHARQDVTNCNVIKHEKQLYKLEAAVPTMVTKSEYDLKQKETELAEMKKDYEKSKLEFTEEKEEKNDSSHFWRDWKMKLVASIVLLLLGVLTGHYFG